MLAKKVGVITAVYALLISAHTSAAVPTQTDDAGVLSQGGWEYTLFIDADQRDVGDGFTMPGLEVAYGVSDTLQAAVTVARAVVDEPGSGSRSDFAPVALEAKWLAYEEEGTALSLKSAYEFPLTESSKDRGIVEDVRVLTLAAVGEYTAGDWATAVEGGYDVTSSGPSAYGLGIRVAYNGFAEGLQALAEVYTSRVSGEDADETGWTLGFEYETSPRLFLQGSVGGSLDSDLASAEELDSAYYVGIRYETE